VAFHVFRQPEARAAVRGSKARVVPGSLKPESAYVAGTLPER
jgi:hypothetical protein